MRWTRRGAIALPLIFIFAAPAVAHSLLLGSDPGEGTVLRAAPGQVTLRFNEPVQLTALRLFAADTTEWPLRRMRDMTARPEHRADIARELTPGAWRAVWRAISADGHEIGGTLRFRLETPP
jgi:copper transport protein